MDNQDEGLDRLQADRPHRMTLSDYVRVNGQKLREQLKKTQDETVAVHIGEVLGLGGPVNIVSLYRLLSKFAPTRVPAPVSTRGRKTIDTSHARHQGGRTEAIVKPAIVEVPATTATSGAQPPTLAAIPSAFGSANETDILTPVMQADGPYARRVSADGANDPADPGPVT